MKEPAFPPGHFYSPVVNTDEAEADAAKLWPPGEPGSLIDGMKQAPLTPTVHGIDWQPKMHERLLRTTFPGFIADFDYPETGPTDDTLQHFYEGNSQFSYVDARVAFCLLRRFAPARIIEVGSGYSTLLMTDVNKRFLGNTASITCVEPYPRPFMQRLHDEGAINLIEQRAQDVALELFDQLQTGDVLFIDSSHVSKTGSDVNRLILDVLPRLAAGVYIHFHDIFFPDDYPKNWVVEEGFSWSEQYLLQALLLGNEDFEVIFGCSLARTFHAEALFSFMGKPSHGASFWMRKTLKSYLAD